MASDNLKNEVFQVFVYGTLKPGERAYQDFCEPFLVAKAEAKAPGRLYHLPMGYPAMTLESGWVFGVCLTFKDPHVLRLMDEFEDYFPDRPQDSLYQRIRHTVYGVESQHPSSVWVYVMERKQIDQLGGQWLADGCWSENH
jgi:gamma-glutamylcyclotransferase (GGCT)/AIG2-like uncharacterized protein YtfP